MEKKDVIKILIVISILFFAIKNYIVNVVKENDSQWIDVLSSQIKKTDSTEKKTNKKIDSLELLNAILRAENKTTKQNINLILKSNEEKKRNLLFVSDSVKLFIIDSMLRANGYR